MKRLAKALTFKLPWLICLSEKIQALPWSSFQWDLPWRWLDQGTDLDHLLQVKVQLHSSAGHHISSTIFLWTQHKLHLTYFWIRRRADILWWAPRYWQSARKQQQTEVQVVPCLKMLTTSTIHSNIYVDWSPSNPSSFWKVLFLSIKRNSDITS